MSFNKSNNNDAPVFDKPPQNTAKGFFIRRLMSLAGKPVLAEKNLPIRPSSNEFSEKCYVNSAAFLYRQQSLANGSQKFKPVACKYAVPQHNSFAQPERLESKFNHISVYNPRLKAVFGNKPVDSSADFTITSYRAVAAERFDNHAATVRAYPYAKPDTAPRLLGSHATLNSIKLAGPCENIKEPALFSGFKKRLNWQPRDFAYPDFQIIFCSQFPDDNAAFMAYLPGKRHFALFPGNYGFLPTEQSSICNLTQNTCTQAFSARTQPSAEGFDSRTEFARNLVIICNSNLRPVEGQIKACHGTKQAVTPSCAVNNRPLNALPNYRRPFLMTPGAVNSRFNASSMINSPIPRDFQADPGLNWPHSLFKKEPFAGALLLNMVYNVSRSRMKLRLRLKHASYHECMPEMISLMHRPVLLSKMLLPTILTASFKPLIRAESSRFPAAKAFVEPRPTYVARRSAMRFTSGRHAHYCRKALMRLLAGHSLPEKAKQKDIFSSYYTSQITPDSQCNRDRFSSAKPHNEAINVIYLRSMPFLMKLSAMDFTDIFLPDAQRRAAPAGTRFLSDLSPLPLRRRNTLKSLRFKLTRINDDYASAALRAQRRILSPSAIFSIYNQVRQIRIAEAGNMPTVPAKKAYQPGYRGRLEKFAISGSAPSQIIAQMKLRMPISGQTPGNNLVQKHFIYPATWETVEKHYKCRIILSPHPFGFPQFRLPVDSFHLVESATSFKFVLPTPGSIGIAAECSFSREKVFLPPLSLKNPRRFLFPEGSHFNAARDHFHTFAEYLHGKIKTPAQIDSFEHDWGLKRTKKLAVSILHRMPAVRARQKATDHFTSDLADVRYPQLQLSAPLPCFLMPRIHRLLLDFDKFYTSAHEVAELPMGISTTTCSPQQFSLRLQVPATEAFRKPGCAFIFKKPRKRKFDEKFSHSSNCQNNDFNFRHRPRIFRFPYRPEHTRTELNIDFRTQEEPLVDRLTFLDQISLEGCYLAFAGLSDPQNHFFHAQMNKSKSLQPDSFVANIRAVGKQLFYEHSSRAETRLDYEKSRYPQQLDESAFKKLIDVARLKLRKFKHIRSHITGYLATNLLPLSENFGMREGSKIPQRLFYDNLHWIILLRSFVDLPMHARDHFDAKIAACSEPHFSSLKASFSSDFYHGQEADASNNLKPARKINSYALSTISDGRISLAVNPSLFCSSAYSPTAFALASVPLLSYICTDAACELKMSSSERPEYRRNIELYILHMVINIEDYDLFLGVSGRPLAGKALSTATACGEYRHPHLPDWLDLPQPLVHRTKMCI